MSPSFKSHRLIEVDRALTTLNCSSPGSPVHQLIEVHRAFAAREPVAPLPPRQPPSVCEAYEELEERVFS